MQGGGPWWAAVSFPAECCKGNSKLDIVTSAAVGSKGHYGYITAQTEGCELQQEAIKQSQA